MDCIISEDGAQRKATARVEHATLRLSKRTAATGYIDNTERKAPARNY
jgi:hypothetical protein